MEDSEVKKEDRKSFLIPELLKSGQRGNVIQSITILLNKIALSVQHSKDLSAFQRIMKVLIRGISSRNTLVQKNYFLAIEMIIISYKSTSWFSLKYILDIIEAELYNFKASTKGEEGEILLGKVLIFGVLVRSGVLVTATEDEIETVLSHFFQDMKGKSYLPLVADPFLIQYIKEIDASVMKKTVWQLLQKEVSPGPNQPLVIYHALLVAEEKFPSIVTAKYLQQNLGGPRVLTAATVPGLVSALQNDFKLNSFNHPIYSDIFKYLTSSPDDVLQSFWMQVDSQLLGESTSATTKQVVAVKFFTFIISQLEDASQVPGLLTPKLVSCFMRKCKGNRHCQKILQVACKEALYKLCQLCSKSNSSKLVSSIINKLMFDSGSVLFDLNSGTRVVHQLSAHLSEKGVMKLASKLRDVIANLSSDIKTKEPSSVRSWLNTERLHVTHLFCNLLALQVIRSNLTWRLDQLIFLFDLGFFPTNGVGVELAGLIRESFYGCLNQKLPNLVDLRNILGGIVRHINTRLDNGDELRVKLPAEVITAWKKMFTVAEHIGEDSKKEQWVTSVFQTMFYHIGLHLFKEPKFAADVLQELHSVYERVSGGKSKKAVEDEPHWTEVVVEMILSLLSRNSHLHRHLIGCIFSHFCPHMTPQNIHQILQVLDPSNNSNPLLNSLDTDSESSSEEGDMESILDEADEEVESSDDGMSDDVEEEIDEKANDKLRRAVFEALGENGAQTDVESVDLDEMDEAEAARVDKALSEAFRANRQSKSKKPPAHTKALTNFRIRVLDLVEICMSNEPPLDLLLDSLLAMIALLEHSLVDRHQAPLESRVRTVIRKLTSIKKYNVSECPSLPLGNILRSLLDKGNRTTTVYMSIVKELVACTIFFVKASQQITEEVDKNDPTKITVFEVLKDTVKKFFYERDCLLTVELYQKLFQQNVPYIVKLASKLPKYAFDPNVHPFRRYKALEFLITFWKSNRILMEASEEHLDSLRKISKHLYNGSVKIMEEPAVKTQPKFVNLLKQGFELIRMKGWMLDVDWKQHIRKLIMFQKTLVNKKEKKNNAHNLAENNESITMGNEETEKSMSDDNSTDKKQDKLPNSTFSTDKGETSNSELEENDSSNGQNSKEACEGNEQISSVLQQSQMKKAKSKKNKNHLPEISCENGENSNEEVPTQSDKKSAKKRSLEKSKRTQLLKNNSKQLRVASMAEGLEEGVFSKYKLLTKNKTPQSPDR